jgi:cyclopropane-fatty-acyl-phospholipid synthase
MSTRAFELEDFLEGQRPRFSPQTVKIPSRAHPVIKAFGKVRHGALRIEAPDGRHYLFGAPAATHKAHLQIHDWKALDALLARGEVGFAEAYVLGQWDSNDLPALLHFGLMNADVLERYFYGKPWYALKTKLQQLFEGHSIKAARENIFKHYDLGNDFYKLWLDESMTYSCALFHGQDNITLEEAQQAKYKRILGKLNASPRAHILEIGCGWGGFASAAAHADYRVTAVTISLAQKQYAEQRIIKEGIAHLAKVEFLDYRELKGQFDHIVSIGMFEHVGESQWPVYFKKIREHLKPGGCAMVQSIVLDDAAFKRLKGKVGFIEQCIFPGGMLPSKARFREEAEKAGLTCKEMYTFGQDYAITLGHWLKRFNAKEKEVRALGHDENCIRLWRFYLASCIASFTSKRSSVMQVELRHAA